MLRSLLILTALGTSLGLSPVLPAQTIWDQAGYSGSGLFPIIAIDPTDSDTMYLGSDVAGLYRSSDRGTTWTPSSMGLQSLQVASLAIDPSDPDRLWLATPMGLHLSIDGGVEWSLVDASIRCFKHTNTRGIAVSSDGQTILVASHAVVEDTSGDGTLYRSTDAGETWSSVLSVTDAEIPAVMFDPIVATRAFLLVSDQGVRRSIDGGATWASFTTDLPANRTWRQIDVGSTVLYATAEQDTAGAQAGVFKSSKTTAAWTLVGPASGEDPPGGLAISDPVRIDLDSFEDQRVFLGQDAWPYSFYVTDNGGTDWTGTPDTTYQFDLVNAPHWAWMDPFSGPQDIAVDPQDTDLVYYTTWVGLWASSDGGASFTEKVVGAQNTCQTDLLSTGTALLTTNMDGGVYRSTDGGATWVAVFPAEEIDLHFWLHAWKLEQASNGDLYFGAGTTDGVTVYRSTDDGVTWSATAAGLPNAADPEVDVFTELSLAADPNASGTLYVTVDFYGLYKTTDSGANWELVVDREGANGPDEVVVKSIEVDPLDSQRLFMGEHWNGLWYSENGGQTWSQTTAAGLEGHSVQEIVALADGRVFAAYADGVYVSTDHGHSFSRAFPIVPGLGEDEVEYVTALAVNPDDPNDIAASTAKIWPVWTNRGSVWRTFDGGTSWSEITGDLPVHRVRSVEFAEGRLWAATWCANLYSTSADGAIFTDGFEDGTTAAWATR